MITKVNAFRRATSAVRREYRTDDGRLATLAIDEITHDAERVVRHVLCDVVDTARKSPAASTWRRSQFSAATSAAAGSPRPVEANECLESARVGQT